jgi:hypothetical protein
VELVNYGSALWIEDKGLVGCNWFTAFTAESLALLRGAVTDQDKLVEELVTLVELVVFLELGEVLEYG